MRTQYWPLGSNHNNCTLLFSGSDNEQNFIKMKKLLPNDWLWSNREITYNFNRLCHRNDFEFEDINPNNTSVILGCSHIEGTGVSSDYTIPAFYQNISGEKTYNLGQGGMDNEIIFYNALWAHHVGFKKIIVCWTYPERNFLFYGEDDERDGINIYQASDIDSKKYLKYFKIDYMTDNPHWDSRLRLYDHILKKLKIHTFKFFSGGTSEADEVWEQTIWKKYKMESVKHFENAIKNINALNKVYARDVFVYMDGSTAKIRGHFGPYPNKVIAEYIYNNT